jgi:hypothetical protein
MDPQLGENGFQITTAVEDAQDRYLVRGELKRNYGATLETENSQAWAQFVPFDTAVRKIERLRQ